MQLSRTQPISRRRSAIRAVGALLAALVLQATAGTPASAQDSAGHGPSPLHPGEAAPAELSLDRAVERAVRTNETVLMARSDEARAEGIVREVRSDAMPQVTADFGYTRNVQNPVLFFDTPDGVEQITLGEDNDYSMSLSVRQTLFDFSLGAARSAARLSREASASFVEAARSEVTLDVRSAYFDALLAEAMVEVQEQALEQAIRRLEQVEEFYEAGTASEFELLTAQVEVENRRPPVVEARNQRELARNRLKRTVNLPLDREIRLTDDFMEPVEVAPQQEYAARARQQRPDLKGQRTRVSLQDENLKSQQLSALPSLEVVAGLTRQASSDRFFPPQQDFSQSTTAGLSFSLPLFDGRARSGRVQQARAEMDREEYRLRQLEENILLEVQQAYQEMEAARERIDMTEANVARAERALEIAETRFANGLSTQLELQDAQLSVTQARTNHAEALHTYSVARARLAAAVGER